MSEAPKLFTNKPKKAQLKQFQGQHTGKDPASAMPQPPPSSAAAASHKMGPSSSVSPPPPPPPPKESFARRYRFLWPLLLVVNLAVGGYVLMRTRKKDTSPTMEEDASDVPSPTTAAPTVPINETTSTSIVEPVMLHDPVPMDKQRELFKWILEEKRKVKPKDSEEKKRIDDEKAILKQFIRAKSIPNI